MVFPSGKKKVFSLLFFSFHSLLSECDFALSWYFLKKGKTVNTDLRSTSPFFLYIFLNERL